MKYNEQQMVALLNDRIKLKSLSNGLCRQMNGALTTSIERHHQLLYWCSNQIGACVLQCYFPQQVFSHSSEATDSNQSTSFK